MPSPGVRIDAITRGLAAAGLYPRVKEHGDHVCVEARIPASASTDVWRRVLVVLEAADFFGLVNSARQGRIAWAAVNTGEPATRDSSTAQGHDCHMKGG